MLRDLLNQRFACPQNVVTHCREGCCQVHDLGMPHVYILRCSDGSFYVGSTRHLERRVFEHNEGVGAAYTRRRRPVELVWSAECERIDEAFAMEKRIQGWSRVKRQALIDDRTDELGMLSSRSWAALRERGRGGFS